MEIGDKIIFFDENHIQLKGVVDALRPDKRNPETKKVTRNLIDVKVSRLPGTFQIYENTPLKSDLADDDKTFCYELQKKYHKKK